MTKVERNVAIALFLTAAFLFAFDDGRKEVPTADQVKILKAQHEADEIEQKKSQLVIQFNQLNQQIMDLKAQYQALDQPGKDAQKKVDAAIADAAKTMNIDMAKYAFDKKELAFTPKAPPGATGPPVPAAPAAGTDKK